MRAWRNVWMFHAATGGTLYCRAYWSEEGVLPTSVKCHVAQSRRLIESLTFDMPSILL